MTTDRLNWATLTLDDLFAIGIDKGIITPADVGAIMGDNHAHPRSTMTQRLGKTLWSMFCNGEIGLGTIDPGPDTSCVDCGTDHRHGCPRPWVDDLTFTVEVDFTDRRRDAFGFVTNTRFVTVAAADDNDATLTAAQMVGGMIPTDHMVTATRITAVAA